jgi:hypothetical protein
MMGMRDRKRKETNLHVYFIGMSIMVSVQVVLAVIFLVNFLQYVTSVHFLVQTIFSGYYDMSDFSCRVGCLCSVFGKSLCT